MFSNDFSSFWCGFTKLTVDGYFSECLLKFCNNVSPSSFLSQFVDFSFALRFQTPVMTAYTISKPFWIYFQFGGTTVLHRRTWDTKRVSSHGRLPHCGLWAAPEQTPAVSNHYVGQQSSIYNSCLAWITETLHLRSAANYKPEALLEAASVFTQKQCNLCTSSLCKQHVQSLSVCLSRIASVTKLWMSAVTPTVYTTCRIRVLLERGSTTCLFKSNPRLVFSLSGSNETRDVELSAASS